MIGPTGPQGPQGDDGERGPPVPPVLRVPTARSARWARRVRRALSARPGPMGPAGADGEDGELGPTGPTGPQGAVPQRVRSARPGRRGRPDRPAGQDGNDGEVGPTGPTGPQGPAGEGFGDGQAEYGVAKVYLHRAGTYTLLGTVWSSDVPDDGNNAASTSATLPVPDLLNGDEIEVYGAMRTEELPTGGTGGHMGAVVLAQGFLVGAPVFDQTPLAGAGVNMGTSTVPVPQEGIESDGPTQATGALLASVEIPSDGGYVISGTVQTFDFHD